MSVICGLLAFYAGGMSILCLISLMAVHYQAKKAQEAEAKYERLINPDVERR